MRRALCTAALLTLAVALPPACGDATTATAPVSLDVGPLPTIADGPAGRYRPAPGVRWYWQLQGPLPDASAAALRDVELVDLDLLDASAAQVAALQARGRRVVCYFSAGSHEAWRADADAFPPDAIGRPLAGWPGERWVDTRHPGVRAVVLARLDRAVAIGCDGVEPDNVDGFLNRPGFDLTADDAVGYLAFLADAARQRGLSVGLKNLPELAGHVEPLFDWALTEECAAFDECAAFSPFIAAGKAVLHVEYVDDAAAIAGRLPGACAVGTPLGLSTAVATWDLDGAWAVCP